jgi:translation elongation factor EF-Ts
LLLTVCLPILPVLQSCLLDQRFVLDDSVTVQQLLKAKAAQLGLPGALEVAGLLRAQVGEGLARDDDKPDFAAEVAAMAGGGSSGGQ